MKKEHWLRNNLFASVVVAALLGLGLFYFTRPRLTPTEEVFMTPEIRQQLDDHQILPIQIGEHRYWVEVVTTPASITQGLSERVVINENHRDPSGPLSPSQGMLFVFPEVKKPSFWMYRMNFDLDLVWIRNGKITEITANVPKPEPGQTSLPTYSPEGEADMVLEIPAGFAAAWQLKAGEAIFFPTLTN